MKNLHGVSYDMQLIIIHGPLDFASCPPQRVGCNTKLEGYAVTSTTIGLTITYCEEGPT